MASLYALSYSVAEVDAQIENYKSQLLAANAAYSISPSDGGTSRSVTRNDIEALRRELEYWLGIKARMTGAITGGFRIKYTRLDGRTS